MNLPFRICLLPTLICVMSLPSSASAELKLPTIIGDGMVLQRHKPVHIWGWAMPGQQVTVKLKDRSYSGVADDHGRFSIKGESLEASFEPLSMKVTAGTDSITINNILIGEVWLCSGQSNMQWSINRSIDGDLATLSANNPHIRLITVPMRAAQEPQTMFDGQWNAASPETVPAFSAVGYFFGKKLFETIHVPVGLINNSWGGSAAEAWTTEEAMLAHPGTRDIVPEWHQNVAKAESEKAELESKNDLSQEEADRLKNLKTLLYGNKRPANLYNGCLSHLIGYSIRGVLWYQGETNAGRAYQYRELFPVMITQWRRDWDDEFSFYWVQLADYMEEKDQPSESAWAELREAQTMATALPKTGQAVIIDLGTGSDIHPTNKEDVASRLLRHTLAKDYGFKIQASSPTLKSFKVDGNSIVLTFDQVADGLKAIDFYDALGFTIAGDDQVFYKAHAKITDKNTIVVTSLDVKSPTAVRYAWVDNPVANIYSSAGLPLTPFRTDNWKSVTQK